MVEENKKEEMDLYPTINPKYKNRVMPIPLNLSRRKDLCMQPIPIDRINKYFMGVGNELINVRQRELIGYSVFDPLFDFENMFQRESVRLGYQESKEDKDGFIITKVKDECYNKHHQLRKDMLFNIFQKLGLSPTTYYNLLDRDLMYGKDFKFYFSPTDFYTEQEFENWLMENGKQRKSTLINSEGVFVQENSYMEFHEYDDPENEIGNDFF